MRKIEFRCPTCKKRYMGTAKNLIEDRVNYRYCKKCYKINFWDSNGKFDQIDYDVEVAMCQGGACR